MPRSRSGAIFDSSPSRTPFSSDSEEEKPFPNLFDKSPGANEEQKQITVGGSFHSDGGYDSSPRQRVKPGIFGGWQHDQDSDESDTDHYSNALALVPGSSNLTYDAPSSSKKSLSFADNPFSHSRPSFNDHRQQHLMSFGGDSDSETDEGKFQHIFGGPDEKDDEKTVEILKKTNALYAPDHFHPKLLNVHNHHQGDRILNGRIYYPASYEDKGINVYPLSDEQMTLGLDQDIMFSRIWTQVEKEWSRKSDINAELAVILYEYQKHWPNLLGEDAHSQLIGIHSTTDLLMKTLVSATNKSIMRGAWFDAADSSDLIEVLVTLTGEQRKKMNSNAKSLTAFCAKMIDNREVKSIKQYRQILWKLCNEARDESFKTDDDKARESAELLNKYLGGELKIREEQDKQNKRSKSNNKQQKDSVFTEEKVITVEEAEEKIIAMLAEANYSQLRLVFEYAIGRGRGQTIDEWLAAMVGTKKQNHFWQTFHAIVTDAVKGRPHFFAQLLKHKLGKLFDNKKLNDDDAHWDIVRILITRAQVDLVEILDMDELKNWKPEVEFKRSGSKSVKVGTSSGRQNKLLKGPSAVNHLKPSSSSSYFSQQYDEEEPAVFDNPMASATGGAAAHQAEHGVLKALDLAKEQADSANHKARVAGYKLIVELVMRPEWSQLLAQQYQNRLDTLREAAHKAWDQQQNREKAPQHLLLEGAK